MRNVVDPNGCGGNRHFGELVSPNLHYLSTDRNLLKFEEMLPLQFGALDLAIVSVATRVKYLLMAQKFADFSFHPLAARFAVSQDQHLNSVIGLFILIV